MALKHLLAILAALLLTLPMTATAGDLEPAAGPDDNATAMYMLDDIYNQAATGFKGQKRAGGFTEPEASPDNETGRTLDEVMSALPQKDSTNAATPADVAAGTTYWGLKDGAWGLQTGTAAQPGATCDGTLVNNRWCDQNNGTVKDMTTGLIWLKDANCTDTVAGISNSGTIDWFDAIMWSGVLESGNCGLSDGSQQGTWRLPTKSELQAIGTHPPAKWNLGLPAVTWSMPGTPFVNVQSSYWSSTAWTQDSDRAWDVVISTGYTYFEGKNTTGRVWPVRTD